MTSIECNNTISSDVYAYISRWNETQKSEHDEKKKNTREYRRTFIPDDKMRDDSDADDDDDHDDDVESLW